MSAGATQGGTCHESGIGASLLKKAGEGRHTQVAREPEVDGTKMKPKDDERTRDKGAAEQPAVVLSDFYELVTAWVTNG